MGQPGVHSDLPEQRGEREVARALIEASAGRWDLWFNLQRNNNEMDDLVLAPDIGCFCIEVKDWRQESILEYSDDAVERTHGRDRHPFKQAQIAMHGLMSFLDDRRIARRDKPYFYATAALPQIRRSEMYDEFGDEFARHFEGMIFAEEIEQPDRLTSRLIRIGDDPPLGGARQRHVPRLSQIDAVRNILNRKAVRTQKPMASGMAEAFAKVHAAATRAATPEAAKPKRTPRTTAARREALWSPGASVRNGVSRVVFHGKAGTGKTTDLLKVALAHALQGRQTLVCCFTKVLATELRARMALLPGFDRASKLLLVTHLDQLAGRDDEAIGIDGFQTICVDEAQDVAQEKFDLLRTLAASDAEWFLADAPEQAIFSRRSEFLDEAVAIARQNGTWETKRVNRRSGKAETLVCDAVLELAPDDEAVDRWVSAHPIATSSLDPDDAQEALEVDVVTEVRGYLPEFAMLPEAPGWQRRVDAYAVILREEVERQARDRDGLDLAVVSIRGHDVAGEWKMVKAALHQLQVPFLDQVDTANRRLSPNPGEVRLATVHSMRGVDADRVVLIDIEGLEGIPDLASRPVLLNIGLSRARSGTRIVLRPREPEPGSHRNFVERLVVAYRLAALG